MATKKEKARAYKEAIKEALETLEYYKKQDFEDVVDGDMSDLICLGSLFSCFCPEQSGETEEMCEDSIHDLNERATRRRNHQSIWTY